MHRGPEDSDAGNSLVKRMKRFVRTNMASTNTVELWHLFLEVKSEVRTNYGDEHDVEEMMNTKTMMAIYTTKHHPTRTSTFSNLMD
jgi:hypothetical protein